MEKIQMTEEQADQIYDSFLYRASDVFGRTLFKNELKVHGYIRKSVVEEAEEEYIAYKEGKNCFVAEIVMDKMYLAIQEFKSEIARLKK